MISNYLYLIFIVLTFSVACENSKNNMTSSIPSSKESEAIIISNNPENQNESGYSSRDEGNLVSEPAAESKDQNAKANSESRKLIKTADLKIMTSNLHNSKKNIDIIKNKWLAYYENENMSSRSHSATYLLKIRVPSNNFDSLVNDLEKMGDTIDTKTVRTNDVSLEYTDLETRLENKRSYLKRYREILSKAAKIDDILAIEDKVRILEEEIESTVARIKYLSSQVGYSTINIELYQKGLKDNYKKTFTEKVQSAFLSGWSMLVSLFLVLINIWPLLLAIVALYFYLNKNRRLTNNQLPKDNTHS